jgi:hypothetical protein
MTLKAASGVAGRTHGTIMSPWNYADMQQALHARVRPGQSNAIKLSQLVDAMTMLVHRHGCAVSFSSKLQVAVEPSELGRLLRAATRTPGKMDSSVLWWLSRSRNAARRLSGQARIGIHNPVLIPWFVMRVLRGKERSVDAHAQKHGFAREAARRRDYRAARKRERKAAREARV